MSLTCPHCSEDFNPDKPPKPGSRVVCTACFRSFTHGGSGSGPVVAVAATGANTGSSDLYESLLDDGSPSPRSGGGRGGSQTPFKRTVRSLQHDRVDCSKSLKRPFESSRGVIALFGILVLGLLGFGGARLFFGKVREINEGVGKVGRVHSNKQEGLAAPKVEAAKKKADDEPLFEDSSRATAPSPTPQKLGNVSVAITSAAIDVVNLQDGTQLTKQCLVLALQVKNYSVNRMAYKGWSSATKLCYVPQRGNVERVPSSPGNPFVGAAEPTQIVSEGTLNDLLVFEIPELNKDLELDLVPNGQGDTFYFVIPGKRITRKATGGFVQSKMAVPKAPATPNPNAPPSFRPPQTGGFQGNASSGFGGFGGGATVTADVTSKVRAEYERDAKRIEADYAAQKKAAKSPKARRAAEDQRSGKMDSLVAYLCRTYGITEADLDRIVKAEPGK